MEVKRICQWCGKPFIAQKTTTCYCSPQCSKRGYKHRMMERKMELRHMQEMQELRSSLEKQEYFTFSQAARLMGVSRQYIYKLVKEEKLRASRLSGKMSLIRKASKRPSQIHREIPEAVSRVLDQNLRELEEHGIVKKTIFPELPPRSEYELTELGRSLLPVIDFMEDWGESHRSQFECLDK